MSSRRHSLLTLLLPPILASAAFAVRGFNGDGQTAIVWQNEATKELGIWFLKQTKFVSSGWLATNVVADWRMAAIADFNRDGQPDLLWRSRSSGSNEIWLMNGTNQIARQPITSILSGFDVAGAGDFDRDGYPDILWRDPDFNQTAVWFMDGPNWNGRVGLISSEPDFRWNLAATGDFNQDGYTDIVWRDRYSGRNVIWLLRGTALLESIDIPPQPDLEDRLVGTGAFDLLGKTALLWRHANGQNTVWLMNGTQVEASAALPTEGVRSWQIVGTGGYTNGMLLSATADDQSRSLTLAWRYGSVRPPTIERRELGQSNWDLLATNYIPFRFTNSELAPGRRYEFRVGGEYLLGGVAAAPIEDRGLVLLVIEDELAKQIGPELELLKTDLVGDGWSVIRTNVARHDDETWSNNLPVIASIKSFVTNAYFQDPTRTKAVYLIGHVPIPYSGYLSPDGHGTRALPADIYYGDVDGIFTDNRVHLPSYLGGTRLSRHDNFVGDGKFDQDWLPENAQGIAELELAVGRADFSDLPSFGSASEAELTRRYIQKTHRYRHKQFVLPNRVVVATYFPSGPNREAYTQALKIGSRLFGLDPGSVVEGDPFDRKNSGLWGILGSLGLPFGILGEDWTYHQSANMPYLEQEPRIAFANVFASYLLDFQYPDNFMRAFVATPSYGLAIMWFSPWIPLAFETLGLGETIGAGFVRSINFNLNEREFASNIYVALIGDPTLRLQVSAPPRALPSDPRPNPAMEWAPSPETNASYWVYRSTNGLDGPWIRLTPVPINDTSFTDWFPPFGPKTYQVRAVQLVATGSGSYTNLSQGIFFEAP